MSTVRAASASSSVLGKLGARDRIQVDRRLYRWSKPTVQGRQPAAADPGAGSVHDDWDTDQEDG